MLDARYSLDKLIEFLKFADEKGLMPKATAQSRATAASKFFELASDDERLDVRSVDLDSLANRFANKNKAAYTPSSLGVYRSRVVSAVSQFVRWSDNPSIYKPTTNKGSNGGKEQTSGPITSRKRSDINTQKELSSGNEPATSVNQVNVLETFAVPIPLRTGLRLTMNGMPFDLTESEAERICSVVRAYVIKQ